MKASSASSVPVTQAVSLRAVSVTKRLKITAKDTITLFELLHAWVRHSVLKCNVFKTKVPKWPFFGDECTHNSFFLSLATLVYGMAAWRGSLVMPP